MSQLNEDVAEDFAVLGNIRMGILGRRGGYQGNLPPRHAPPRPATPCHAPLGPTQTQSRPLQPSAGCCNLLCQRRGRELASVSDIHHTYANVMKRD